MAHVIKLTGALKWRHEAEVVGNGSFPTDMLRYDACHPARTEDAVEVGSSSLRTRTVRVVRYSDTKARPCWTPARWASFGWTLKEA